MTRDVCWILKWIKLLWNGFNKTTTATHLFCVQCYDSEVANRSRFSCVSSVSSASIRTGWGYLVEFENGLSTLHFTHSLASLTITRISCISDWLDLKKKILIIIKCKLTIWNSCSYFANSKTEYWSTGHFFTGPAQKGMMFMMTSTLRTKPKESS